MIDLKGSITALITPMRNGAIDEAAYAKLIEWQVGEGTNGFVPVGTTGESPTLSHEEHHKVVDICIAVSGGRVPVIAGTGSNNTAEAISLTQHAEKAGADAALVVTPYYNKPTQEGLYAHYKAIAEATSLPIIIYNIPPRSVINMSVETMARLSEIDNIVGQKDATADLTRPSLQRHASGADFIQLSGEDGTALGYNAHGGRGCISVTANIAPKLCSQFQAACLAGDFALALDIQDRLMPLHDALFCESNPAPVKYGAELLGLCAADVRLPLTTLQEGSKQKVRAAMVHAGLLDS